MKLFTTAEHFLKTLKDGIKVAKNCTIPILAFVKLNLETLTLTSTDLELSTILGLDATSDGPGEFLIPYHAVAGVLQGEKGPLTIEYVPGYPYHAAAPNTPGHNSHDCGCERQWSAGGYTYTCGHVDSDENKPEPTMPFDVWLSQVETTLGKLLWAEPDEYGRSTVKAFAEYQRGESPDWYASEKSVKYGPGSVKLTVNDCEYTFHGANLNNYPVITEVSGPCASIPAEAFSTLLERTTFAISREESRYTLNGALLIVKGENARMVTTDGHRLSLADAPGADGDAITTIVPADAVRYLESKAGKESVYITISTPSDEDMVPMIRFVIGNRTLVCRKLSGQFPNYEAVMPNQFNRQMFIPSPATIGKTLGRVAKCADERSGCVRWSLSETGATLSAESTETGKAKANLPVIIRPIVTETAGADNDTDPQSVLAIGLNSSYISEFLKVAGDEPVTMNLKDGQTAAMFHAHNDHTGHDWKYVVMPMRM